MKLTVFSGVFLLLVTQAAAIPVLQDSNHQELTFQADLSGKCPNGFSQPDNSNWAYCYQVNSDFKTPKDASTQCKASGGALASVPNSYVNSYLYYLATQVDATSVWLGVECFNGAVSTCMNDDGNRFNYSNFKNNQPNPDDNCVYLSAAGRDSQQWSTFDCEQRFSYACEVAAGAGNQSTPTPTPPPRANSSCPMGYREYQNSGICYKYFTSSPILHDNAAAVCKQISGGNLASITSSGLNQFLQSMVTGEDDWVASGLRCPNVQNDGDKSSCAWDDGTPFVYDGFAQGCPKVVTGFCGNGCCAYNYGQWSNCFPCDTRTFNAYFCQAKKQ